ncbi:MAG: CBS domain-containing protein [Gammaproteobacteria bacterium]|nr:CBS domain-containing protein [Gammaproteobacteria bacterium]
MKTVKEVLAHKDQSGVVSVAPITTVYDTIQLMSEHHIGAVPVILEGKLVGIMSERDYARKVILKDKSSKATRVSEIMTQNVITVDPEDRVDMCVRSMRDHHIRHLIVLQEGEVVGVLSLRDLFSEIIAEQADTIEQLESYIRGNP